MALLACVVVLAACAGRRATAFQHDVPYGVQPWTHADFDSSGPRYTFAVVSDLNGGERPDVFRRAVAQLRLLRPELVLSVGDLIDGPEPDSAALRVEWESFDARARAMPAPFFRVGGNHGEIECTGRLLDAAVHGARSEPCRRSDASVYGRNRDIRE